MIRVAIYDDNEPRCKSLEALIALSDRMKFCGYFTNCKNIIAEIDTHNPDVLLMDIEMPGINGIEAVWMVKQHRPDIKVIMQTAFDDGDKVFAALRAGAEGYLLKSALANDILRSIEEVFDGGAAMTPSVALRVIRLFAKEDKKQPDYSLSPRETEVLKLLSDGKSYKMIADLLQISYFTVNSHVKKIYEKMQVNSVGEALSLAYKNKIV